MNKVDELKGHAVKHLVRLDGANVSNEYTESVFKVGVTSSRNPRSSSTCAAVESVCAKHWISSSFPPPPTALTAVHMAPSARELTALIATQQAMRPTGYEGRSEQGGSPCFCEKHCVTSEYRSGALRLVLRRFGKYNSFHLQG
jgi:hypothetical protein